MPWYVWVYDIIAVIVAICSIVLGFIGIAQSKSEITGRYAQDDARGILFLLTLGPLVIAPLWLPSLFFGGIGFYTWSLWKVNRDAHLTEIPKDFMANRALYKKYQESQARNAALSEALELEQRRDPSG